MQSLGGEFCSHAADRRSGYRHNGRSRQRPDTSLWINSDLCTILAGLEWQAALGLVLIARYGAVAPG